MKSTAELLAGMSSAMLEVNAFETPVLVLRVTCFDVEGGTLPLGTMLRDRPQRG